MINYQDLLRDNFLIGNFEVNDHGVLINGIQVPSEEVTKFSKNLSMKQKKEVIKKSINDEVNFFFNEIKSYHKNGNKFELSNSSKSLFRENKGQVDILIDLYFDIEISSNIKLVISSLYFEYNFYTSVKKIEDFKKDFKNIFLLKVNDDIKKMDDLYNKSNIYKQNDYLLNSRFLKEFL